MLDEKYLEESKKLLAAFTDPEKVYDKVGSQEGFMRHPENI